MPSSASPGAGRRAALPEAEEAGDVSGRPLAPPQSPRRSAPASQGGATWLQPPLPASGSRPPPPTTPELFTPPGPARRRRRRCRLFSTLAPSPTRPPPPPPPQPRLSGASSSHQTLRNRDSNRAGRKLPRHCQGDEAVRAPAAFPPLSSSRSAPSTAPLPASGPSPPRGEPRPQCRPLGTPRGLSLPSVC